MTLLRYLLLTVALFAGAYASVSWICGQLTDAGIAGAISAALVLASEGIAYCQRRNWERARRTRAEVWERRDSCLLYTSPSPRDISGSRMPSSA